jgi:nitric oxide reductase activation protein
LYKKATLSCNSFYDEISVLPWIRERFIEIFKNNDDVFEYFRGALTFYSDYRYRSRLEHSTNEENNLVFDNNGQKDESDRENSKVKDISTFAYSDNKKVRKEKKETESKTVGYVYTEWNNDTQEYLYDWCYLHEISSFYMGKSYDCWNALDKQQVKNVRQVFERLKPDFMRKQKNLHIGDEVVLKTLVNYHVERKSRLCPEEKIYCKDFKDERDIATALLIDISGSTAEKVEGKEVLEIEKSAAFLLAEGLKELGDKFGIFGFSTNGRENCSYYIFKEFEEEWKEDQQQRLIGCRPLGNTRIGVAIRHTTAKLKDLDSHRKLIIIITDGKPQDCYGYSTEDLYAQYDVRMACIEAKRNGIVGFCLSTQNNSLSELELMFPEKRYLIMRSITELPKLLARSYIKLTT